LIARHLALLATMIVALPAAGAAPSRELRVFAASSLTSAFRDIAQQYEKTHSDFVVRLNLAGSQQLAAQIEQGAPADLFASADLRWMSYLAERSLVDSTSPTFARNRLVVIVPRTNPARISRLQDLARSGVKLVMGAATVPVGRYGREMLSCVSRQPGFAADFATKALRNIVSEEENVKSVVSKVQLGEADAGVVYRSDVTGAVARYVRTFEIPDSANVLAEYPIAVLRAAAERDAARDFIELVLSAEGQAILEQRGLMRAAGRAP